MSRLRRHFARFIAILFFFGWITYPGWYHQWYYPYPEWYAWPASLSNQYDPHWGFWYY